MDRLTAIIKRWHQTRALWLGVIGTIVLFEIGLLFYGPRSTLRWGNLFTGICVFMTFWEIRKAKRAEGVKS